MDESGESNFLIDGFPRNDENLNGWNASTLAEKVSYNYSYSFNTIGKSQGHTIATGMKLFGLSTLPWIAKLEGKAAASACGLPTRTKNG